MHIAKCSGALENLHVCSVTEVHLSFFVKKDTGSLSSRKT